MCLRELIESLVAADRTALLAAARCVEHLEQHVAPLGFRRSGTRGRRQTLAGSRSLRRAQARLFVDESPGLRDRSRSRLSAQEQLNPPHPGLIQGENGPDFIRTQLGWNR